MKKVQLNIFNQDFKDFISALNMAKERLGWSGQFKKQPLMESLLSLLTKAEGNINVKAWKVRELVKWDQLISIAGTALSPMYGPERKGDIKHSLVSIQKAEELIGYKTKFSVKEGIRLAMQWYKSR